MPGAAENNGQVGASAAGMHWFGGLAALGIALAAVLIAFHGTVEGMVRLWWESDTYGHGFFILPLSLCLIWSRRHELAVLLPRPEPLWLATVACGCIAWLVGQAAGVQLLAQLSLILVVQGIVLSLFGWRVGRCLAFPLLYLYLMVPFGSALVPYLQDLTALLVVQGLRAFGVPVFSDGLMLRIPAASFEIAEACAGLRFLITVFALSLVFAYLAYEDWGRRFLFLAIAVGITIAANALRAFAIVFVAHNSGYDVALQVDHITFGWVFLSGVMLLLFLLGLQLRPRHAQRTDKIERPLPDPARAGAPRGKALILCAFASLAMTAATAGYERQFDARRAPPGEVTLSVPAALGPWRRDDTPRRDWNPEFVGADGELRATYRLGKEAVDLYIAYYSHQRQGAEIVNARNQIADMPPWRRSGNATVSLDLDGQLVNAEATLLATGNGGKRMVLRLFWIGGSVTASEPVAKLLEMKSALLLGQSPAAAILISGVYDTGPEEAKASIQTFLADLPPFETLLQ